MRCRFECVLRFLCLCFDLGHFVQIPDEDIADANDPAVRAQRLTLLSMGRSVLDGKTTIKEMVDDSFNKWAKPTAHDLPEWFAEDDAQHWKPHGPAMEEKVTAGALRARSLLLCVQFQCGKLSVCCACVCMRIAEDRARVAAIADKPIKKVAEAKARKKKKLRDRLDKVSTKATAIAANGEMTQQQRVKMISKL